MIVVQVKQTLRRLPRARILLSSLRPAITLSLGLYRTLQWPHLRFPVLRYPRRRRAIYLLGFQPPVLPPVTVCPNVVGLMEAAAVSALNALGLLVNVLLVTSDQSPAGTVLTQSIVAGQIIVQGASIILDVSSGPAPPPAGFRVQAVTAGEYNGVYYVPGDVFDLLTSNDFSDSTVNYEGAGGETYDGWMLQVPSSTPLYTWSQANVAPYFPPQDPARRFVL